MKRRIGLALVLVSCMLTACANREMEHLEGHSECTKENEHVVFRKELEIIEEIPEIEETEEIVLLEDIEEVEPERVSEFAQKIKDAMEEESMEKLAELILFPIYVDFQEEGILLETEEEFYALGIEKIFAEELTTSIREADISDLSPDLVGIVIQKEEEGMGPGITFDVINGDLAIKKINY